MDTAHIILEGEMTLVRWLHEHLHGGRTPSGRSGWSRPLGPNGAEWLPTI